MSRDSDAAPSRLLARLARRDARLRRHAEGSWRVHTPGQPRRGGAVSPELVDTLLARGLVAEDGDSGLAITPVGAAMVRRHLAGEEEAFARQHQERGPVMLDDPLLGRRQVTVNHDESPLAWLRRRKDASGRPMIDAAEFAAGERLRADYERAHLMPRVTANWSQAGTGRQRSGSRNESAELTEAALAARHRVEAAVAALDPELAGLAIDFCCFLKGLEQIESERRWPARSAKVVLRLALAALARHYGLATRARGPRARGTRHWGADGYRPTIDG